MSLSYHVALDHDVRMEWMVQMRSYGSVRPVFEDDDGGLAVEMVGEELGDSSTDPTAWCMTCGAELVVDKPVKEV